MKRWISVLILISFLFLGIGVLAEESETPEVNNDLDMSESLLVLERNQYNIEEYSSVKIGYSVNSDVPYTIVFTSSNPLIARVDDMGNVDGLLAGDVVITVLVIFENETSESGDVMIRVLPTKGSVLLKHDTFYLIRGRYYEIEFDLSSSNFSKNDVVWTSTNPVIASVVNGVVTGHKTGSTTIRAVIGSSVSEMVVHVTVPLESLAFNPSSLNVTVGEVVSIPDLIFVPYDTTTSRNVVYESSDTSIVTIKNGKLVPHKAGTTHIIARIRDVEAILKVNVAVEGAESNFDMFYLNVIKADGDSLFLEFDKLVSYERRPFVVVFPETEILDFMNHREISNVVLTLPSNILNNIRHARSFELPEAIMNAIENQTLNVVLKAFDQNPVLTYSFTSGFSRSVDLKYSVSKLDMSSPLYTQIDGLAYQIRFANPSFPKGTSVLFDSKLVGNLGDTMHFLYLVENQNLVDTGQSALINNGFIRFEITDPSYVVTFSKLSLTRDRTIITSLGVLLGVVIVGMSAFYVKRMVDKKRNVL